MARQILVHPHKDKKNGDSFSGVVVTADEGFSLAVGEVRPITMKLSLEPVNVLEKQTLNFVWTISPNLAKHGVLLVGAKWVKGVVTAYLSTLKDVNVKKDVAVLEGMAVESVLLRTTDHDTLINLNNLGGKEI